MAPNRRAYDRDIGKRLYERFTPWVQLAAWFTMFCTMFIGIGIYYSKVEAYDEKINLLSSRLDRSDDRQEKIMILLQRIDQRVSDMYDREHKGK